MRRALAFVLVLLLAALAGALGAHADEPISFWQLPPKTLRLLVASPQVMVSRTSSGWESYCRCPVVLAPAEIPEVMKTAIVAVEDKRYFDHGGVDVITLLSVLKGGFNRGGSTIPMQLLKNLVFHDLTERDALSRLERKGAELWNAGAFDAAVGKQDLLAAYLNQIEFGGREIVGLYRASRHYFRKDPRDLTLYEAALLAGMVQAPARFNPLKERTQDRAHERARLVLRLMQDQGKITEAERRRAEQAGIRPGILPEFKIEPQAFNEWVVQTWGDKFVQPGETVRFFVTLAPWLQHLSERHLDDLVTEGSIAPQYDAGAVMMSPGGRVQAMVGSIDWSRRQFNHAVKASVQAGSTAKLPVLIAACEHGMTPDSRVLDQPLSGGWPSNGALGYAGETSLKEAFASSRNAAAVRLTRQLGIGTVAEAARRIGIDPGVPGDPGFVLGSFSTNVMAMTSAYAAIANGGYRVSPSGVLAVVDGRGHVRADFMEPARTRVIPEKCIKPTQTVLGEVVRGGTGRGATLRRWAAFGKTGTTSGNADAWFVGWSEGRVLGVWMGRQRGQDGGTPLAGAGAPADYFKRVMNATNEWSERLNSKREPVIAARRGPEGKTGSRAAGRSSADNSTQRGKTLQSESSAVLRKPLPPPRPRDKDLGDRETGRPYS